jgi:hypothetical protein
MCATDVSSFCDAGVQRVRRAVFNASDIFMGYADVDDLINNTLGAAIGFLCYKLILKNNASLR